MRTGPSLDIKCVEKESNEFNGQFVGVNVISGKIGNIPFEFPSPAATQIELKKANQNHETIDSNIVQYYYQNRDKYPLNKIRYAAHLIKKYEKLMKNYPNSIPDINFDYIRDYKIKRQERDFIIKLQGETNSVFLTDVETDRNQDLGTFTAQLRELEETYTDKIICPTIDLNALPQAFLPKLQHIVTEGYQKFNVVFGGFIGRQENWLSLSREIFAKPIWCNIVNLQRRFETVTDSYVSNISLAFVYGIHTISVGYPRRSSDEDKKGEGSGKQETKPDEPTPRVFNPNNLMYEETKELSKNKADIRSFKLQQTQAAEMRKTIGKEFFSEYAKKSALENHLGKIKGRI